MAFRLSRLLSAKQDNEEGQKGKQIIYKMRLNLRADKGLHTHKNGIRVHVVREACKKRKRRNFWQEESRDSKIIFFHKSNKTK